MSEIINKCREEFTKQYKLIYNSLDDMRDRLSDLLAEADTLNHLLELQAPQKWHPSSEIPSDDALYIVRTKTGSVFVSSPVSGKWFDNIVEWMELPK